MKKITKKIKLPKAIAHLEKDKFAMDRIAKMKKILASGKVVRFSCGNFWKDVDNLKFDAMGDLESFRSHNALSKYVCWERKEYSISAIDR